MTHDWKEVAKEFGYFSRSKDGMAEERAVVAMSEEIIRFRQLEKDWEFYKFQDWNLIFKKNKEFIDQLINENNNLREELEESSRLHGLGGNREHKLLTQLTQSEAARLELRVALEQECYCTDEGTYPSTCDPCQTLAADSQVPNRLLEVFREVEEVLKEVDGAFTYNNAMDWERIPRALTALREVIGEGMK